MNQYPVWKNLLVVFVVAFGIFFSMPNIYGEDPAVIVSRLDAKPMDEAARIQAEQSLNLEEVRFAAAYLDEGRLIVRFDQVDDQLVGADALRTFLGENYVVALTLTPRTPEWMRNIGLQPMSLGLDLRGGVYLLYEVDLQGAITQALSRYETDFLKIETLSRLEKPPSRFYRCFRYLFFDAEYLWRGSGRYRKSFGCKANGRGGANTGGTKSQS